MCGTIIKKGDLIGMGNITRCYKCTRKSLGFRIKVLNNWKRDKQEMLQRINDWLAKPEVSSEMMLRTIEGDTNEMCKLQN